MITSYFYTHTSCSSWSILYLTYTITYVLHYFHIYNRVLLKVPRHLNLLCIPLMNLHTFFVILISYIYHDLISLRHLNFNITPTIQLYGTRTHWFPHDFCHLIDFTLMYVIRFEKLVLQNFLNPLFRSSVSCLAEYDRNVVMIFKNFKKIWFQFEIFESHQLCIWTALCILANFATKSSAILITYVILFKSCLYKVIKVSKFDMEIWY